MIIGFVDLVGSTDYKRVHGRDVGGERIQRRLQDLDTGLSAVESVLRLGPYQGDGFLFVGYQKVAIEVLRRALELQETWDGPDLLARITLGIGVPNWNGPAWSAESSLIGSAPDVVARLQAVCPPQAVVIDEGLHVLLKEHPRLRARAIKGETTLKGWGNEPYWVISVANLSERSDLMSMPEAKIQSTNGRFVWVVSATVIIFGALVVAGYVSSFQQEHVRLKQDQKELTTIQGTQLMDTAVIKQQIIGINEKLAEQGRKLDELLRRGK